MASVPSFDPNQFIPAISANDWATIQRANADPLTNRTISAYAPGSIYKVVTALAGLTKGLANARFTCTGGIWYGNTYMRCWGVHGNQNLIEAITHSCDVYFYQYGNAAGIDAIDRVGNTLGLGQSSRVELTGEDPGLLPSADWLNTVKNERWTPGQTADTSIGQGYVLASPLQMAMVTAAIANGGTVYQPTLIYQIQEPGGSMVRRIIQKILALDKGYNPGLKRLDPAIGNYNPVESVDFERGVTAQVPLSDGQNSDAGRPANVRQTPKRATVERQPEAPPRAETPPPQNLLQRFFRLFR